MNDEDAIAAPTRRIARPELESWAVDELEAYIQDLNGEISRAQTVIGRKQQHRLAADTFFRGPR